MKFTISFFLLAAVVLRANGGSAPDPLIDRETHRLSATRHAEMEPMRISSSIDLADPMSRESSGTAWVPDSTPIYGKMIMLGDDMLCSTAARSRATRT